VDSTKIRRKKYWMENSMEEDLWEDHETGRRHQEGLFVVAECTRMKEGSNGQGYLETHCWKGGQDSMQAVAPLKKKITKMYIVFTRVICTPAYFAHPNF
jgi:hypothetical protein